MERVCIYIYFSIFIFTSPQNIFRDFKVLINIALERRYYTCNRITLHKVITLNMNKCDAI